MGRGPRGRHGSAAGIEVAAVARGAQLEATNQGGITLWIGEKRTSAPIHATDRPETLGRQDVVLVTLKSSVLPAAASQVQTLIGPKTTVVFAMNDIPFGISTAWTTAAARVPTCRASTLGRAPA